MSNPGEYQYVQLIIPLRLFQPRRLQEKKQNKTQLRMSLVSIPWEKNCTCQIPGVQTGNIEILLRKLRNSFVISSADCRVAYCRQTAKSTKIFLKINTKRRRERKYHVLSALMLSICIINIYLKCLEMRNDFYVIVYYPEKEQIHDLLIAFSLRCEELRH